MTSCLTDWLCARNGKPDKMFHSAWKKSNQLIEDIEDEEGWEEFRGKILEEYRKVYRE